MSFFVGCVKLLFTATGQIEEERGAFRPDYAPIIVSVRFHPVVEAMAVAHCHSPLHLGKSMARTCPAVRVFSLNRDPGRLSVSIFIAQS